MVVNELCEVIKKQDREIKYKEEIILNQNREIQRLNKEIENLKNNDENNIVEKEDSYEEKSYVGLSKSEIINEAIRRQKYKKNKKCANDVLNIECRGYYDDTCYDLADGDEDLASVIFDNID